MSESPPPRTRDTFWNRRNTERYLSARATAWVSGGFCIFIALVLVLNSVQLRTANPLDSKTLAQAKAALVQDPGNEHLKRQIRDLDWRLRREFFRRQDLTTTGACLLLASFVILLFSLKEVGDQSRKLPMPAGPKTVTEPDRRRARIAVVATGLTLCLGAVWLIWPSHTRALEDALTEGRASRAAAGTAKFPSLDEIRKQWPYFRGPYGTGLAEAKDVPLDWNGKTGAGVLWKTEVPLPGQNSPVVWGNRIFLTGATKEQREIYCFDTDSGKLLWRQPVKDVPNSPSRAPEVSDDTGFAASTCATDGQRVYAIYANGDVACCDFTGKQVWARSLGLPDSSYGYASSLTMYQDLLIVQMDQGSGDAGKSKLLALDTLSGRTVWQKARPVPQSWGSPATIEVKGKPEVVACGDPWLIAYDPRSGDEIWKAQCLSGEIAPSPAFADSLVYAVEPYNRVVAVRADGDGDVTKTKLAWSGQDGIPDICSPVSNGKLVFLLTSDGLLTCCDAVKGGKVWDHDFGTGFRASPVIAGDKLLLLSQNGEMIAVSVGRTFRQLARAELGEHATATPAFLDGRIYLRGDKHLFGIGKK